MLAGCARNAPQLPPDLGHLPPEQRLLVGDQESPEGRLNCPGLKEEAARANAASRQLEGVIASNRGYNTAIIYVSSFLPPLALVARTDEEAKTSLDTLQVRRDRIDRLAKAKNCGAMPSSN
ncbi:MAG: hypothetical protein HQ465_15095 [Rhodospirillales bacterium]|nr:hypothetical protein [Rhodospirillales bacterium]